MNKVKLINNITVYKFDFLRNKVTISHGKKCNFTGKKTTKVTLHCVCIIEYLQMSFLNYCCQINKNTTTC